MSNYLRKIQRENITRSANYLNRSARKAEYKRADESVEEAQRLFEQGEHEDAVAKLNFAAVTTRLNRAKHFIQTKIAGFMQQRKAA